MKFTKVYEIIVRLLMWNFVNFHEILFKSVKYCKIFAKLGYNDLKILLNIHCIFLFFVHAVQNSQIFLKLSLWPLLKFGGKV